MKSDTWRDDKQWTHIDWELDDVTPRMLDWFWCNMDKADFLWHPNQHHGFEWWVSVQEQGTPLGSIHIAPQTWSDGKQIRPYIRIEPLQDVPEAVRDIVKYDHLVIVAGISILGDNVKRDDPALAYRIHQWQKTDGGVAGMSSAVEVKAGAADNGLVWAAHAREEVGNWEVFLPALTRLYRVITDPAICPCFSFKVEGRGRAARYVEL